jgi:hypothetical protein
VWIPWFKSFPSEVKNKNAWCFSLCNWLVIVKLLSWYLIQCCNFFSLVYLIEPRFVFVLVCSTELPIIQIVSVSDCTTMTR